MARKTKRKRSLHAEELQEMLTLEPRQSMLSTGIEEGAIVRCEKAEATTFLIKRPCTESNKQDEDSRRAPYMRLATFSCVRIGDFARQSYRMTTEHFWRLFDLLSPFMDPEALPTQHHKDGSNQALRLKAAL
jgi:hypothetical protein